MPRPTTAQLAYGSLTVVLSTFAALLLSDVRSGAGVVAIAAAGLLLGLIVAVTVSTALSGRSARRTVSPAAAPTVPRHHTHGAAPLPRTRVSGAVTEARLGERSLRR